MTCAQATVETRKLELGNREYTVQSDGVIYREPFQFITPSGVVAVKPRIKLKPNLTAYGYHRVNIAIGNYFVHRMVYEAFHGPIPDGLDIDHIDGNRVNNSPANLRTATRSDNSLNRHGPNKGNKSGHLGVYFHKSSGRWVFGVRGKVSKSFGLKEQAIRASREYHGF